MKKRIAMMAALLHLSVLAGFALPAAFSRRAPPSEQKPLAALVSLLKLHSLYSALHADYGFFSPEIGSSHDLEIEVTLPGEAPRRELFEPANREVEVRLSTMLLIFTRDRLYQELMARSIAAHALERFPSAEKIAVSVHRFELPSLEAYRQGAQPRRHLYFRGVYETGAGATSSPLIEQQEESR